jgi:hypothetical protein
MTRNLTPTVTRVRDEDQNDPEVFQYRVELNGVLIGFVTRGPGYGITYNPWAATSMIAKTSEGRRLRSCERTRQAGVDWVVAMAHRAEQGR